MLPDVQVPDYQTAYNSLGNVYDPMTASVNTQLADLPRQQQAVQSSLDQAKINAFRDITNSANAKGVLFSGFTPDQQAQYIGTKYLPAVAQNETSFNNARTSLVDKINQINAQRSQQAQGIVSSAQTAAQNAAYKNAQLAISQQKAALSAANSSSATKAATVAANQNAAAAINDALRKNNQIGRDGYLSPYTYNDALSAWVQEGLNKNDFTAIFGHYANPNTKGYQK